LIEGLRLCNQFLFVDVRSHASVRKTFQSARPRVIWS